MDIRKKADLAARMLMFIAEQKLCGKRLMKDNNVLFISDVRDEMGGNFACVYDALDKRRWNIDTFLKPFAPAAHLQLVSIREYVAVPSL